MEGFKLLNPSYLDRVLLDQKNGNLQASVFGQKLFLDLKF